MDTELIDVVKWGDGPRWIVSTAGDAETDQPRTERELADSNRFHGPFNSQADAERFAREYAADDNS